ncbi:DUF6035 family protein [Endozoicomonas sp. ONNA2]|uniref:DUF6035 family protein n=1 Tax=Endozoicomonas sp. ONNA2 TaxID=2828741 RepID=UPI0021479B37|nr:DUF6035 family protein [Endozoicomonas sp. ONNA2]
MSDERRLQIPVVQDISNGEYIRASRLADLFEQHEIQTMRSGSKSGRFVCPVCSHGVYLHAVKDSHCGRGHSYHFQHPSGVDCEWKGECKSKGEIYRGVQEGSRHQDMKLLLAETLPQLSGWAVIDVDRYFVFNQDKTLRGKPDLHAQYYGDDIVFEIQLRSETPEIIMRRKQLYADKGWRLLWISADNASLVSEAFSETCLETRQVQKDIAFSNRGNWFIFNKALAERSLAEGRLILLARHWTASVTGNRIEYGWQESLVAIDDLTFSGAEFFYKDFDQQLTEAQAELRETGRQSALELIKKERFSSWDHCLTRTKSLWPSMDFLGEDGEWLNQQFREDYRDRELQMKQWIVKFLRSHNWRKHHKRQPWLEAAERLKNAPFGIQKDQPLAIFEKLLLILGYSLSPHLGPGQKKHIQSCHNFFDYESHFPYRALCEKAISISPYRDDINQDKTMVKRSALRQFVPQSSDLDALFQWFISDPALPIDFGLPLGELHPEQ